MGGIEVQDKGEVDSSRENKELIEREIAWFKKEYGVGIEILQKKEEMNSGLFEKYYIDPPSVKDVLKLLKELKDQIIRLPSSLIQKAGLKKIVLCGNIEARRVVGDERKVRGMHGFWSRSVDFESVYIRSTFCLYHELFHMIASAENEEFYFQNEINFMDSELVEMSAESKKSNADGRKRVAEAKKKIIEWKKLDPADQNADLEAYNEERANYFGYLLNTDKKNWYFNAQRPPFPAKVEAMKEFMKRWSGGALDDQFFDDIKSVKVDSEYWNIRNNKK